MFAFCFFKFGMGATLAERSFIDDRVISTMAFCQGLSASTCFQTMRFATSRGSLAQEDDVIMVHPSLCSLLPSLSLAHSEDGDL
jgi:hypothetical protein